MQSINYNIIKYVGIWSMQTRAGPEWFMSVKEAGCPLSWKMKLNVFQVGNELAYARKNISLNVANYLK